MTAIGHTTWAIAGGKTPLESSGPEPEFTSCDELCILNTTPTEASITLTVYFTDRDPIGPYKLNVPPQRMRSVKFNDLIDPLPIPLNTDYACTIEADVPVIVQFNRRDTSQPANAIASMTPFSI